ncbi:MAG: RNA polymerase sigma factor [Thermomicrobiaceae bacterium]
MSEIGRGNSIGFAQLLEAQRPRIVRLCAQITGDRDAAEDLAQETLVEAWKSCGNLEDPTAEPAWLSGIARNVCKRWFRRQTRIREIQHRHATEGLMAGSLTGSDHDLAHQLERDELVDLLDRALHLLPPVTRAVLIQKFAEDRSQLEISSRLGMGRGAVAMRIQRGKRQLRNILIEQFPDDAAARGLVGFDRSWISTRLWCRMCGQHLLQGMLDREKSELQLRCPVCYTEEGITEAQAGRQSGVPGIIQGVDGFRTAYERLAEFGGSYMRDAVVQGHSACLGCGKSARVIHSLPSPISERARERFGAQVRCPSCNVVSYCSLTGMLLSTIEGKRFRSQHSRTCTLPEQEIQANGRPALVSRFQSVESAAEFVAITDASTMRVMQFHRTG